MQSLTQLSLTTHQNSCRHARHRYGLSTKKSVSPEFRRAIPKNLQVLCNQEYLAAPQQFWYVQFWHIDHGDGTAGQSSTDYSHYRQVGLSGALAMIQALNSGQMNFPENWRTLVFGATRLIQKGKRCAQCRRGEMVYIPVIRSSVSGRYKVEFYVDQGFGNAEEVLVTDGLV